MTKYYKYVYIYHRSLCLAAFQIPLRLPDIFSSSSISMHFYLQFPTLRQKKSTNSFPHRPCDCSSRYVPTDRKVLDICRHYSNTKEHIRRPFVRCRRPSARLTTRVCYESAATRLLKQYLRLDKAFLASSRHLGCRIFGRHDARLAT